MTMQDDTHSQMYDKGYQEGSRRAYRNLRIVLALMLAYGVLSLCMQVLGLWAMRENRDLWWKQLEINQGLIQAQKNII